MDFLSPLLPPLGHSLEIWLILIAIPENLQNPQVVRNYLYKDAWLNSSVGFTFIGIVRTEN